MKRSTALMITTLAFAAISQGAYAQAHASASASASASAQGGSVTYSDTKDMVSVAKATQCAREAYQMEGLIDAFSKGYTKADIIKVLKSTKQDDHTNVPALLKDLDLYTSNKYIRNAQPYLILDFILEDCLTLR
jgi:hypothetical protein